MGSDSGSLPPEEYSQHPSPDEEREAEIWSYALDHVWRAGRQVRALQAGGLDREASKVDEAARGFMTLFAEAYGAEGYRALGSCYRMAGMEDPKKSLWMGAWR